MSYQEDDFLMISALQHFAFCRRQWALIHLEQQWKDNLRTTEGNLLHERAHNDKLYEKRAGVIITQGLRVFSAALGICGTCDVVEFHPSAEGIPLTGESGTWLPYPVEYKRGTVKSNDADRLQLCAQAICLEEIGSRSAWGAWIEISYILTPSTCTHRRAPHGARGLK